MHHMWGRTAESLTGNTGGNDDDVGILQGGLGPIIGRKEASYLRLGGDVRKVGSNTRGVDDIVERELVDKRGQLEEKRKGL